MSVVPRRIVAAAVASAAATLPMLVAVPATAGSPSGPDLPARTRFYTPVPDAAGQRQVARLAAAGRTRDAALVRALIHTPQAVWFTDGTPAAVRDQVHRVVRRAAARRATPSLVVYNVPGRDCSQYSSGGAGSDQAYRSWVDGFARGLRTDRPRRVVVVVEPDGLANLPSDCPAAYPGEDVDALTAGRIADIRYAGRVISQANPEALVYLDAGHSAWHSVGDIAQRLDEAGVRDVAGFSLNVSNYQPTPQLVKYGNWVSQCVYYANNAAGGGLGRYQDCASQYYPATSSDFSTWHLSDEWYTAHVQQAPGAPSSSSDLPHFVIDTSRNGRGPWTTDVSYPDKQDWCNPPGRGAGLRPTAATHRRLVDAYLWVKTPGQSDGQCNRGIPGSSTDPEWGGTVDPAAGAWFPRQALQLARLAVPPLKTHRPRR
jgi:endoglucanase